MCNLVWVVLGEVGDWSERTVFVSGVFESELEAQEAVKVATLRRSLFDQWETNVSKAQHVIIHDNEWPTKKASLIDFIEIHYDEARKKAIEKVGPQPPYERGERFKIGAIPIGEWVFGEDERDWFDEDERS